MSVQLPHSKRPLEGIQLETNGSGKLHKSAASSLQIHSSGSVIRVLCPSSKIGSVIGKGGCIISQIRQETGVRVLVDDNLPGSDERVIFIMSPDRAIKEKENRESENNATEQVKDNKDTNDDGKGADVEEDGKGADVEEDGKGADIEEDIKGADIEEDGKGADIVEDGKGADIEDGKDTDIKEDEKVAVIEEDRKSVEETEGVEKKPQDEGVEWTKLDSEKENENGHAMEMENVKISGVQKALLLVFEKMVEGELEKGKGELEKVEGEDEEGYKVPSFDIRLIVFSSQIGFLFGKAGSVIKEMSSESGTQIRVIPRDKLPPSVSASDELVQISGVPDAVKKALNSISQKLLENPSRDLHPLSTYTSGPSTQTIGKAHQPFHVHSAGFRDGNPPRLNPNPSPDLLTYRLWCPHDKIGGVIGKGGAVIKGLKNETGCEIKLKNWETGSEDRLIMISGPAHPDDRISAPQDALLRVQFRIFRALPDSGEKNMLAKLLVSSNQIGCLLGKGGSVIAEMRKSTGAFIRILGKDQIPKGASGDEVVQINGDVERVQDALIQITTRLRDHFFRDSFPSMNYPPINAFLDQRPPFPPYLNMREHSSPGRYRNPGHQPFYKFESGGGFPHDDHPPFMHNFQRPGPPGMPHHLPEGMPNWGPQGPMEGGGPLGLPDYPVGPPRRMGGFGGGNTSVITNTTIEVVVPRAVVPSIYGEDGGCLRLIREICDARVNITDPKPGASETTIIISGTPEQTNAAQSLIQAFVISETDSN